ncbi:MAG: hypothetical protein Tp1111SUR761211_47 [Prokaryotic dsDNA virus sp.]|nr:MAG: hypothetical protein Tp1111SUR761211_47 [Prokaryotic dsDNA virus sp.]|tara:strand:- start:820 stop:1194 length:375 start_codon:yes stop_codon:yes gene_type:complete
MDSKTKEILQKFSTQKVNLNITNELRKYPKGLLKYKSEGDGLLKLKEKLTQELKQLKKALNKWSDLGGSIIQEIDGDLNKFGKIAKELGFNPEIQIDYSNAEDSLTKYADARKKYEAAAKDIKL